MVRELSIYIVINSIFKKGGGLEGGGLVFKTFTEKNKKYKKVKKINNSDFLKRFVKREVQPSTLHPLFIFTKFI